MAHVRKANRYGTATEAANFDRGYSPNAESIHTRRKAMGLAPHVRFQRKPHTAHNLPELIKQTEQRIRWLRAEINIETDRATLAKRREQLAGVERLLADLEAKARAS